MPTFRYRTDAERVVVMAVAEGFEPSACPRSKRHNGFELQNNIQCDSLRLPWFVPRCAQNVPAMG